MRVLFTGLTLALALVSVSSCSDGFLVAARLDANLRAARARWESSDIDSYEITVRRLCFCGFVDPVRVRVENGVIVSRTIVTTGDPVPAVDAPSYPDVPGLFAVIDHARTNGADELRTEFDATYGFPTVISIDWYENAVDDEITYRGEGFVALP